MIFELGKEYIVDVTEKGIIPLMVFDKDRWFDKDHDDLDFLTDEEKTIVVNDVLDKIRVEIEQLPTNTRTNWNGCCPDDDYPEIEYVDVSKNHLLAIIDKYKAESEDATNLCNQCANEQCVMQSGIYGYRNDCEFFFACEFFVAKESEDKE